MQKRKSETEIHLLQRKPKNNGACPQKLCCCLQEVRQQMQPMGSKTEQFLILMYLIFHVHQLQLHYNKEANLFVFDISDHVHICYT